MGNVIEVSDDSFQKDVYDSEIPVLVDFWAPWCGPCRALAPVLDEIADEYKGRLKVAKVNVDENPREASKFNVRSIPNMVFFKGGEVTEQVVGGVAKQELIKVIDKVL